MRPQTGPMASVVPFRVGPGERRRAGHDGGPRAHLRLERQRALVSGGPVRVRVLRRDGDRLRPAGGGGGRAAELPRLGAEAGSRAVRVEHEARRQAGDRVAERPVAARRRRRLELGDGRAGVEGRGRRDGNAVAYSPAA